MSKNLFKRNKAQKQQPNKGVAVENGKPVEAEESISDEPNKGDTVLRSAEPADTVRKDKPLLQLAEEGGWEVKNVPEFNIGDIIDGTYKINNKFSGGMGFVYITEPTSQGIRFAIKQPNEQVLSNKGFFSRVITEADAWTSLGMHPHIAYCYFVKAIENTPYIFIEYVEGGNLREWIAEGKCMDIQTSLDMCIQFCHGMELAHSKGMKHRDIKPENVLMTKEGRVKITDFGLAGKLEKVDGNQTGQYDGQTQLGDIMGTKAYMSPEQWEDPHNVDERADLFSFGVSMWEMLCGSRPYSISIGEVPPPPDPKKLRGDLPEDLIKLLYQIVALKKEKRQRDFTELRQQLNTIYKTLYQQDSPNYEIEIADTLVDELNNKGYSYYQIGNTEKAIESWEEVIKLDPVHFESNYNYGYLMWNKGKMSGYDFVKNLEGCKESAGRRAEYWEALAWVYYEQGNVEAVEAIQASEHRVEDERFLKALDDPDRPEARVVRAFVGGAIREDSIAISRDKKYTLSLYSDKPKSKIIVTGIKTENETSKRDKTMKIWEISTGKEVGRFDGHIARINCIAFSPDGRYIISGSWDKTLRLWEISTGQELMKVEGYTYSVESVAFSPDSRYVLSYSPYNWSIMEISTGKVVWYLSNDRNEESSVVISPDSKYALSGSADNTMRLWEISTGKEVKRFEGHTWSITSVACSPDGRFALSGSKDKTIRLWEMSTGKEVNKFEGHAHYVQALDFFPDGRYALSASRDGTMRLWEISTGKEIRRFESHKGLGHTITISNDGSYCWDNTLRLWEMHYPIPGWEKNHPFPVLSVVRDVAKQIGQINKVKELIKEAKEELRKAIYINAFQTLNKANNILGYERDREILGLLTECGVKGGLVRRGLKNVWCERIFEGHTYIIRSVAFSPNGKYVFSGSEDGTMRLWELSTGKEVKKFETQGAFSVTISPDGKYALSGGADRTIRFWEISTGKEVKKFEGHTGKVYSVTISSDGRYVLSGSSDGTIRLWEISRGKEVKRFEGKEMKTYEGPTGVKSVAFSPDRKFVLSGGLDGIMRLWEVSTGKEVKRFEGHSWSVNSVAFSPDGRFVLSGSTDKTIRIWEISSGEELGRFMGHTHEITTLAIFPDGRYALSVCAENTLLLWEILPCKVVKRFEEYTSKINSLSISPDGRYALSGSSDCTMRLWEFDWDWELPEN